jgi:signal transduction histidine kinase
MKSPFSSLTLLWRILLSTSVAITVLFVAMGWFLQDQFLRLASFGFEEEVRAGFQAYDSLWKARADQLAGIGQVLSRMPDVRAGFSTGDPATIRDTVSEVWDKIAEPGTLFLVTDPSGRVISATGLEPAQHLIDLPFVATAARSFPKQARGFVVLGGKLYQIVVTPVYVASGAGQALLNVLVAGILVDAELGRELKASTGGTEFAFFTGGHVAASTLDPAAERAMTPGRISQQIDLAGEEYYQFVTPLLDLDGKPVGELRILRSLQAVRARIAAARMRLVALWMLAVLSGIGLTYLLARRLLRPVALLDAAAAEVARGNYRVRVPVEGNDEMARLSGTFNSMSASIQTGREELIRQERISTIGRLSTSIVHDLRNPLAAIYGGAEMLVDTDLSPEQVRRLAANLYRASRQIQSLLQELGDVSVGRAHAREVCRLREVVAAAYEPLAGTAESHGVEVQINVPPDIEIPMDRSPMERVFQNLIGNAIEAMPGGGAVSIEAHREDAQIVVIVEDTGPGIPEAIAGQLFEPFVTAGKKHGMGLGLALSRKTVVSHGGDLWTEDRSAGARFVLRLPV